MTDTIRKTVVLKAARGRVWQAIADSRQFGVWFGVNVDGPFVAGQTTHGKIVATQVDAEVAKQQQPFVGMPCDFMVERVEPETLLSFRWHPGAEPDVGPGSPTTLVTFQLSDAPGGTELTITESGFDAIPLERRAKVFADNEGGWEAQCALVAKYVDAQ